MGWICYTNPRRCSHRIWLLISFSLWLRRGLKTGGSWINCDLSGSHVIVAGVTLQSPAIIPAQNEILTTGLLECSKSYLSDVWNSLQWKTLSVYFHDIMIFSKTFNEHLTHLDEVLHRLNGVGLKQKSSECMLFQSVLSLGHIVTADGVKLNPDKVKAVAKWRE